MADTDVWQALSDAIDRAVNLRCITMIGDPVISGTLERLAVSAPVATAGALVTDNNLVKGDVTFITSEKLMGAEYADLRTAHQEAVKQAHDIVDRNIKMLVSIIQELGDRLHLLPPPSDGPVRTTGNPAAPNPAAPKSS